jgi:hypothetical protein
MGVHVPCNNNNNNNNGASDKNTFRESSKASHVSLNRSFLRSFTALNINNIIGMVT